MPSAEPVGTAQATRVCVDLNVWVRYLISVRRPSGRATASQIIVEAIRTGHCAAEPIQLVVSLTMLSRLEDVLVRLGFQSGDASAFCSLIGAFARRGPHGTNPHLVLGGGSAPTAGSRMPVYNSYDPTVVPPRADDEDGRVLDTAIAGRADILATFNFDDFRTRSTQVLEHGELQLYRAAHHTVLIARGNRVAEFFRTGELMH